MSFLLYGFGKGFRSGLFQHVVPDEGHRNGGTLPRPYIPLMLDAIMVVGGSGGSIPSDKADPPMMNNRLDPFEHFFHLFRCR